MNKHRVIEGILDVAAADRRRFDAALTKYVCDEMRKPEGQRNAQFLDRYAQMVASSHETGSVTLEPTNEKWKAIQRRAEAMEKSPLRKRLISTRRFALRMAVIFPLIVMCMFIADEVISTRSIQYFDEDESQRYYMQRDENGANVISSGVATILDDGEPYVGNSLFELEQYLGFKPLIPTHVPSGWYLQKYEAFHSPDRSRYSTVLENDELDKLIVYTVTHYRHEDNQYVGFEKNEGSVDRVWINGFDVSVTRNMDSIACMWDKDGINYSLFGPIDEDQAKEIIRSIEEKEGKSNE